MLFQQRTKHIGNILKQLRIENGYTLRSLAREIGIDHTCIHNCEHKKTAPSQPTLEKYHKFFNVSYEYLLGETDEPGSTEIGKAKFESEEVYALKCISEKNKSSYQTLSYLLTNNYGQILLEKLTEGLNNGNLSNIPDLYKQIKILEDKKRIYTQDEIRTFIHNQKGEK